MTKRKDSSMRENLVRLNSNKVLKVIARLKKQKREVESLLQYRNVLEDIIKTYRKRWESDRHFLKEQYCEQFRQMKQKLVIQDMERKVADAYSDLLLAMKQRKSYICHLEKANRELDDFRERFDILILKLSELKDMPEFAEEVRRLKSVMKKLLVQKNSKISALLAYKNSTRSQYKEMESRLKEELQEKDGVIEQLKSEMAKLEADSITKNENISKLSKELESLKSSRGNSVT